MAAEPQLHSQTPALAQAVARRQARRAREQTYTSALGELFAALATGDAAARVVNGLLYRHSTSYHDALDTQLLLRGQAVQRDRESRLRVAPVGAPPAAPFAVPELSYNPGRYRHDADPC